MAQHHAEIHVQSPEDTARLAERLGTYLQAGDCLLLSGGIGAGKSHFARALILSRLEEAEDVPSPTFTLVQTYGLPHCELWHADLYRLGDPDQIIELGLMDAFNTAITLVEWPDRLEDYAPESAMHIFIEDRDGNDTRVIHLKAQTTRWEPVFEALAA